MVVFALLLLAGIGRRRGCAAVAMVRGRRGGVWGLAALRCGALHSLVCGGGGAGIASYLAWWWERRDGTRGAVAVAVAVEVFAIPGGAVGCRLWMPLLGALALWAVFPAAGLADFPARFFPVDGGQPQFRLVGFLRGGAHPDVRPVGRLLIYRLYPRDTGVLRRPQRFLRRGYWGRLPGTAGAGRRSREVMARYRFTAALLPLDWPLGGDPSTTAIGGWSTATGRPCCWCGSGAMGMSLLV